MLPRVELGTTFIFAPLTSLSSGLLIDHASCKNVVFVTKLP